MRAARARLRVAVAAAVSLAAVLLPGQPVAAQPATAPSVQDDRGRTVALRGAPRRIVSLLPSLTETVCELGACDRLVGTDRYSNWPASVRGLPKLGGLEDAQVERIVALKPDLVLVANAPRLIERLESLGLPVLMLIPHSLDDARRVAGIVGTALGDPEGGARLWQRLDARIDAAAARMPPAWRGQRVYVEVASTPHAAGEASFVGALVRRLGLGNIVPPALGAFPQINPEFVLRAQPDLVIAAQAALAEMAARPGWAQLHALREGRTCGVEPAAWDTLVRSGPRLADAADTIADCLQRLQGGSGAPRSAAASR
jgi:iron complex transport system substrate-binding protein